MVQHSLSLLKITDRIDREAPPAHSSVISEGNLDCCVLQLVIYLLNWNELIDKMFDSFG